MSLAGTSIPKVKAYLERYSKPEKSLKYLLWFCSGVVAVKYGVKPLLTRLFRWLPVTELKLDDELSTCLKKYLANKAYTTNPYLLQVTSPAYKIRNRNMQPTTLIHGEPYVAQNNDPEKNAIDDHKEAVFSHPGNQIFIHGCTLLVLEMSGNSHPPTALLRSFWYDQGPARSLLEAAWEAHKHDSAEVKTTSIYHCRNGNWQLMKSKVARSLDTVDFDEDKKTELVDDVARYLSSNRKAWYQNKGIPYRRGYLFHGPSGTGKSSLAAALAAQFNTTLYILSLSD